MPSYKAPLKDMHFVIHHQWPLSELIGDLNAFEDFTPDVCDATLEECAKINETLLHPLNQIGDQKGCRFEAGHVTTPPGFIEAYRTFQEAGWSSVSGSPDFGGQGIPEALNVLLQEMQSSSNVSFSLYPGLTQGVCHAISAHASDSLKQTYLPKMIAGQWTGVMCLTESHCGTDLGLLRTKAQVQADGSYRITGTKIFITAGEHDLAENIVHLVLARTPDAPAGVKGISLFLVSKYHVNEESELGGRNGVSCGSIEHKMGIKGSATCVMNYEGATGYLVGELHQGLKAMFTVMNTERLAIGLQGLGLGEISYQNARNYALDRLQGRAISGAKYPDKQADPIIVHPDIRRMLLTMRAFNEGCRALGVWVGGIIDQAAQQSDPAKRLQSEVLLALFTPVVKAFFTDQGFETCNMGLQVLGGHGYIAESGMEQFVRDARIAQIYEGTNGVQALDLVRRKLIADKGEGVKLFVGMAQDFIEKHREKSSVYIKPLEKALRQFDSVSQWIIQAAQKDPEEIGASSVRYCRLFALVALGYMWVKAAVVAEAGVFPEKEFNQAKLVVAKFYLYQILPEVSVLSEVIQSGAGYLMALEDKLF
jgi:alkylation response protein AidB-like acyl-CoA dehydrogenase